MSLIDGVFGSSAQVLSLRAQRAEMITGNLANADTPGYKAKDIEFESALMAAKGNGELKTSHARHLGIDGNLVAGQNNGGADFSARYRVPTQPKIDGNTVETDVERMAFMDNALRYQATVNFLDGRIKSITSALRGD